MEHITFDITLDEKELYGFNIYQTYTGLSGWMSILIGWGLMILGILGFLGKTNLTQANQWYSFVYLAAGIAMVAYIPVTLRSRVKATFKKNASLSLPLSYDISGEKILVTQGEESAELPWDRVYKMAGNHKRVLIYSNRVNAYVIPYTQLGDENYQRLYDLAKKTLPTYRFKMNK